MPLPTFLRQRFTFANAALLACLILGLSVRWHEGVLGGVSGWDLLARTFAAIDTVSTAGFALFLWGSLLWSVGRLLLLGKPGALCAAMGFLQGAFFILGTWFVYGNGTEGPNPLGTGLFMAGLVLHRLIGGPATRTESSHPRPT